MKKKLRQLLFFMLATVMLFTSISFPALADETTTNPDELIPPVFYKDHDNSDVRVIIGATEEITIGGTSTITITVKNNSEEDWKKTKIQIVPERLHREYYSGEDELGWEQESGLIHSMNLTYPFEIIDSLNVDKNIGPIKSGSKKNASFRVSVKKDLKQGYYPVLFQIGTEDEDGYVTDYYYKTVIVWAKTKTTTGDTEEDKTNTEPVAFALGESQSTPQGTYPNVMNFSINMRNIGYKTAYDVRVEMAISENVDTFPFEINDGNYDRWMGNVAADQTIQIPYSMAIRKDATSGYYPIKYTIRYREEENGNFCTPIEDVMYVRIIGKDGENKLSANAGENERTKARIIVESFQTEPETILAGQDFVLKVKMRNASSNIVASNILFTFDPESVSDSPVFTTINGSNSVVVNNLAPGASEELIMHYSSSPSADQRSYTVTITEQYDSPEFKNAKESVKIAVPLKQEARLKTGNIEVMPNSIEVGNESNIMFDINNTGRVLLYNVTAIFEADSIQRSENYVGNIKPGESGNVDAMIHGIAPTMDEGMIKLTIQYEDESGSVFTVEKELQLFVSEPMPMDDSYYDMGMMDDMVSEPTMMDNLKKFALPLGAVVLAALGSIVFVVRRKKKKAGMDDEIL